MRDILNSKARIDHCEASTLYCIASVLDTTVEEILNQYWLERTTQADAIPADDERLTLANEDALSFYRSVDFMLNSLKEFGDIPFMSYVVYHTCFDDYNETGRFGSAMFLMGLMDFLCRKHGYKPHSAFDDYRDYLLKNPMYPLRLMNVDMDGYAFDACKREIMENAVPELARFNIFMTEDDIRLKS